MSNPLLPQRPLGWTSGDAAGLPIYPGLVKVAEVKAGAINHAIRFTAYHPREAYAYPAGHLVSGRERLPLPCRPLSVLSFVMSHTRLDPCLLRHPHAQQPLLSHYATRCASHRRGRQRALPPMDGHANPTEGGFRL